MRLTLSMASMLCSTPAPTKPVAPVRMRCILSVGYEIEGVFVKFASVCECCYQSAGRQLCLIFITTFSPRLFISVRQPLLQALFARSHILYLCLIG
jgi:hypothetical protein